MHSNQFACIPDRLCSSCAREWHVAKNGDTGSLSEWTALPCGTVSFRDHRSEWYAPMHVRNRPHTCRIPFFESALRDKCNFRYHRSLQKKKLNVYKAIYNRHKAKNDCLPVIFRYEQGYGQRQQLPSLHERVRRWIALTVDWRHNGHL